MKKEEILKLSEKLGMNKEGMELQIKEDKTKAEEIVKEAATFMGVI